MFIINLYLPKSAPEKVNFFFWVQFFHYPITASKQGTNCLILNCQDACSDITSTEVESSYAENLGNHEKSTDLGDRNEGPQTPMQVGPQVYPTTKKDQIDTNSTEEEKVFKKPDKILQCPRCNSLDTKFCYFNNYNVNQPRHFCKNCQRYWTAGGTMRNVPVGAGRRKNKHVTSQYHQLIVSSNGLPTRLEAQDSSNHQLLSCGESSTAFRSSTGNERVLKFGPEAPLCESMETVPNMRNQKSCVEMGSVNVGENGEEPSSCRSSMTFSSNQGKQLPENVVQKERVRMPGSCYELNTPHPLHCYPVPRWGVQWTAGSHNFTSVETAQQTSECVSVPNSSNPNPVRLYPAPMLAVPGFCPPQVPFKFIPATYLGCMPVCAAGAGSVSLTGSSGCLSPSSSASNSCCLGNGSPTLGKHSRLYTDEEKSETCVLVPKTLRIEDPDEPSRSPFWTTSGIKPGQKKSMSRGTIFGTFEPKVDDMSHIADASHILEANPAALSRSHTFKEST